MLTPVLKNIIVKYLNKEASASEMETLDLWLKEEAHLKIFNSYVQTNHLIDSNVLKFDAEISKNQLLVMISNENRVVKMRTYYRVASYAAVFVTLMALGFLFKDQLLLNNNQGSSIQTKVADNNIKIGSDKATLTLADGSEVILNKGASYQTAYADSDGEALVYKNEDDQTTEVVYNVLTIPRGGQFFIQLTDGTKIWLNSESQLKYPVAFVKGKTRQVELLYGEAYFEVSPSESNYGDAFKVQSSMQTVEVLGTQFNIKAYKEESEIYTTLIEGKVRINKGNENKTLQPGQQSIISADSVISVIMIDVNMETAWKQGLFSFKDKSLKEIMIVLARWYDVDISFENEDLQKIRFKGVLSKDQALEDILLTIKNLKVIKDYEIHKNKVLLK